MNRYFASGYMAADPKKIGESVHGPVVIIKLAVDSGKDKVSFPELKAFGKIAETALTHYRKGAYLETVSEFQSEKFERDGETIYSSSFVLQEFPKVVKWPKDQAATAEDVTNYCLKSGTLMAADIRAHFQSEGIEVSDDAIEQGWQKAESIIEGSTGAL